MKVAILHELWQPSRLAPREDGIDAPNSRQTIWETPDLATAAGEHSDAELWFVTEVDVMGQDDVESVGVDS